MGKSSQIPEALVRRMIYESGQKQPECGEFVAASREPALPLPRVSLPILKADAVAPIIRDSPSTLLYPHSLNLAS